jgi:hypothetical protein
MRLTPELATDKLIPAIEATYQLLDQYDINRSSILLEPFVELIPGQAGGSCDLIGVSNDGKTILNVDYKFGHFPVSPKTPQLMFYALAASVDPSTEAMFRHAERLILAIVQPTGEGHPTKVHGVPISALDEFEDAVYEAIDASDLADSDTPPISGPQCKYCPALPICPAKSTLAVQAISIDPVEVCNAIRLDPAKMELLAAALPMARELKGWAQSVEKLSHEMLEAGEKIEGYKLVNKRASRVWNDPDAAMTKVRRAKNLKLDEACDISMKSPPQLEKLCKTKKIPFEPYQQYISAISSGTTLVPQDDKRPEALPVASLEEMVSLVS